MDSTHLRSWSIYLEPVQTSRHHTLWPSLRNKKDRSEYFDIERNKKKPRLTLIVEKTAWKIIQWNYFMMFLNQVKKCKKIRLDFSIKTKKQDKNKQWKSKTDLFVQKPIFSHFFQNPFFGFYPFLKRSRHKKKQPNHHLTSFFLRFNILMLQKAF